jgi:hypothetical protein
MNRYQMIGTKLLTLVIFFLIIFPTISITINANEKQESYDLLIIAPEVFVKEIIPLVNHKNQHGIQTILVTTEEIYAQTYFENNGRDDAEKVKYFIKDAIETWDVNYVLLIGGRIPLSRNEDYWVPVRYSQLIRNYPGYEQYSEGDFLTDLYFADIYHDDGSFSSWDDDNDGVFGEWALDSGAEDRPDLYPDISVGRLPCVNTRDVKTVVQKIIDYETMTFDESWFKKIIVIAGDTYPVKTPYIDGEVYTQEVIDLLPDFASVKIWSSLENLHWVNIVREINKGAGFVFFSGHGGGNSWATHPPYDIDTWIGDFKLRHMNFLFNKERLPVCLSASGCFNNMFNVSPSNSFLIYGRILGFIPVKYFVTECWGWALVNNPHGGSIATIASSAYSYESSDIQGDRGGCEWLDIHFFEEYIKGDSHVLGDCWQQTINRFLQNFSIDWDDDSADGNALVVKNLEQWVLIGDPSLHIGGYSL